MICIIIHVTHDEVSECTQNRFDLVVIDRSRFIDLVITRQILSINRPIARLRPEVAITGDFVESILESFFFPALDEEYGNRYGNIAPEMFIVRVMGYSPIIYKKRGR